MTRTSSLRLRAGPTTDPNETSAVNFDIIGLSYYTVTMIRASKLQKSYNNLLFSDLSFVVGNREKIGLVGINGTGKSTLLKIILKQEEPDGGRVEISNDEVIGYLPQLLDLPLENTIDEFLKSYLNDFHSERWKIEKLADEFGLDIDSGKTISELSEGNKMKLYMTKTLYQEPTTLLLDEPTNHLDIEGILWFEDFIRKYRGACLMISHDRQLLNNTIQKVFEIDEFRLKVYEGNYEDYIKRKSQDIEKRSQAFHRQGQKEMQMEKLIEKARKIRDGKARGKAVRSAKKRLEREVTNVRVSRYKTSRIDDIDLKGTVHIKKTIMKMEGLSFGYKGGEEIIQNTDFQMFGKERVLLQGPNGVGKSTLVKLIIGELHPTSGEIRLGDNLTWEYFSQGQEHLPDEMTLQEYVVRQTDINYHSSFGFLERFLFTKQQYNTRLGNLSPGQRARLSFAIFSKRERQLMILDEPANHLDIQTKEVIEDSLRQYNGSIFLISHDRYFSTRLGITKHLTIQDKKLIH